jgi:outer membrane protein TolC
MMAQERRDEGDEMKFRWPRLHCMNPLSIFSAALVLMMAAHSHAEPLPLDRAIRLALAHSTSSAIADADVQRAFAAYHELRDNYVPQLFVGSGLGYTYGYPLTIEGSHRLLDVVAQTTVFNPGQRQFVNAAKMDWRASEFQDKDQRNAVIQDVAVTYAELAKWEARLLRLQQYEEQAQQMEQAVAERLQAGVDSAVDLNRAKLTTARVRLHRAEARGSADVLRRHLATLTGLPVSSIEIAPETIPALPPVAGGRRSFAEAIASSPAIKLAEEHSLAESMRASAEHRSVSLHRFLRPIRAVFHLQSLRRVLSGKDLPEGQRHHRHWPQDSAIQRQPARPRREGRR